MQGLSLGKTSRCGRTKAGCAHNPIGSDAHVVRTSRGLFHSICAAGHPIPSLFIPFAAGYSVAPSAAIVI
jgi:hypothetical protein